MPRLALALLTLALVAVPTLAESADRLVPREFPTIGDALQAAVSGDRIVVFGGEHRECLTIAGRSDLTLLGKKNPVLDLDGCPAGLTIADGARITVEGFTLVGATLQGILVEAAASEVFVEKTTIADASPDPALSLLTTGIAILGATDVTLDHVTIRGATLHGVHVVAANRPVVKRSTIGDGLGDGIRIDLGTNAKIEKNELEHLVGPAIVLVHEGGAGPTGGAVSSLVLSNRIRATAGPGIVVAGTSNLIEGNTIDDAAGVAIEALPNGGGSVYRRNTVRRALGVGVVAGGTGDVFERATVLEPGAVGIVVAGDANVFVASKVAEAATQGFHFTPDASGNGCERCLSVEAGANGFRVEGTSNRFVRTKATKSAAFDLSDAAGDATTNEYVDCNFKRTNVPLATAVELEDF